MNHIFRRRSKILVIWRLLHVIQKHLFQYFIFMILIKSNQKIGIKNFQHCEIQNGMLISLDLLLKERDHPYGPVLGPSVKPGRESAVVIPYTVNHLTTVLKSGFNAAYR